MYDKTLIDTPEKALAIINELIALNKQLEEQIDHYKYDELTTLMLRKDHNSTLRSVFRDLVKHDIQFMYANLDLNGLHEVNRRDGYLVGDSFIKAVAVDLINKFKECHIFRIGGDEFAIIKKGTCLDRFEEMLSTVSNVEFGHICVTNGDFKTTEAIVNHVDAIIIDKKSASKRRNDDRT